MTLMEVTYDLQSPVTVEQFRRLGAFANTYGLRRFHTSNDGTRLTFEYDASRLKEPQVARVLKQVRISVAKRVDPLAG